MSSKNTQQPRMRRRAGLGSEQVDDSLLILDKQNEQVHRLNSTASVIWELLDENDPTQIAQRIVDSFDVTYEVASRDVQQVISELQVLNLLEICEQ